ncbi:hypothetical protein PAAG_11132 [Paracoccidioides lutzii Pb01]|uniref:Bms1-type G domain-containing protein n=1 Tax=Paracoccidioides lutzii (strain ATCC MYA-826 / Pb01) TaxID=502779 RepID=A0A0A2V7B0_PARBA|nr:hypothetical protein PAAG_11132 [Paracoccidioides lutzii Pb01]KGQ02177.1 hypothetical protein PAAG_11132 [Paracoccidioides lutzii Pb01]
MEDQVNRPHRKSKEKKKKNKDLSGANPKAFAVAHAGRLQKQAARSHDIKEKRLHVPLVDRLPEEAPPIVVAVVGPPGVGKTTLVKSLIKRYTKQTLSSPAGPLTVVTSKRRRLTFLECPSDSLASMIDVAKIADIVLLMIDGNYGFEMETMEFLNSLSASGMPGNVFGILTHLDLFKKQSTLRQAKKRLKHRFWSELYQGAKLFYLSGVINGRYPDREIHNLSRFLSVMKNPRPLIWRNSHPYCLADRFLDITAPTAVEENPKCDRTVALYGYLRGTNFPALGARVHVPGVGDLSVSSIEALPDPCPTPFMDKAMAKATGKPGRRRLGEKQKLLFAPMSDVGGVLVDKDAVYIDVKTSTFDRDAENDEKKGLGEQLVVELQGERKLLGQAESGDREGFANAKDGGDRQDEGRFGEDDWYEAQKAKLQKQLDINRAEFDFLDALSRARAEGYKAGTYARIVLENVPCEFSTRFNPRFPVIVGGLAPTEDRFGYVQVRIKRHRWHKKILKTNDPLIFSLGWRRFQTTPVYSISDSRTRNRMLKYTPEHMHCFGTFYGPLVAPNTGFCCVQSFSNKNPGFRIAATGVVLNVDETTEIVKKLKLTGYPYKIFRNTAFIKDMFTSAIEIAKFEGASIRTVSGIRGQIKRALSRPEGHFRATFEDKILMSDIVFLRAWYPIKPHRYYNPSHQPLG